MLRILFICEGQTEQIFCNNILLPAFQPKQIYVQAPLIQRSKGGIVKWTILKQQIETHLIDDTTAYVTTFIDYYGLSAKHDFPNWEKAEGIQNKNDRMTFLEEGMRESIAENLRDRFIPYIQLHEFEGLLFNNINVFYEQIPNEDIVNKAELQAIFDMYSNPEMINNNKDTAPLSRLGRIIKGYKKNVHGDILAEAMGLHNIRAKSPRFHHWITTLEGLEPKE